MATDGEQVEIPEPLREKKLALGNGEKPRATVRELLWWFNAERRGFHVVRRVRSALDALDLITWPDFEGEYIDQEVFFMTKPPMAASTETPRNQDVVGPEEKTATTSVDPSHRLGRLKAANCVRRR